MNAKIYDLEEGSPTVQEAIKIVRDEINNSKKNKVGCILFIHGYGSSGVGGAISIEIRRVLNALLKNNKIKTYLSGTEFGIFNPRAQELNRLYPKLSSYYNKSNVGISVVEI